MYPPSGFSVFVLGECCWNPSIRKLHNTSAIISALTARLLITMKSRGAHQHGISPPRLAAEVDHDHRRRDFLPLPRPARPLKWTQNISYTINTCVCVFNFLASLNPRVLGVPVSLLLALTCLWEDLRFLGHVPSRRETISCIRRHPYPILWHVWGIHSAKFLSQIYSANQMTYLYLKGIIDVKWDIWLRQITLCIDFSSREHLS